MTKTTWSASSMAAPATTRWLVSDLLEDGMRRLATGIAESFGARAKVSYERIYPEQLQPRTT